MNPGKNLEKRPLFGDRPPVSESGPETSLIEGMIITGGDNVKPKEAEDVYNRPPSLEITWKEPTVKAAEIGI
jgi:hypothetical protein